MGLWICYKDKIKVIPEINDEVIKEFVDFSKKECPPEYKNEMFSNVWFFDTDNNLVCIGGKFSEPTIWLKFLEENFFRSRGYSLGEKPEVIAECEEGYQELMDVRQKEYEKWRICTNKLTSYMTPHII